MCWACCKRKGTICPGCCRPSWHFEQGWVCMGLDPLECKGDRKHSVPQGNVYSSQLLAEIALSWVILQKFPSVEESCLAFPGIVYIQQLDNGMGRLKFMAPLLKLAWFWRTISTPELSLGSAGVFTATVLQISLPISTSFTLSSGWIQGHSQ